MNNKKGLPNYKDTPELVMAAETLLTLRAYLVEKYGDIPMTTMHLVTCLLEEYFNRNIEPGLTGDLVVVSARAMAPDLLDQIVTNELMKSGDLFSAPGNNEIH